MRLESLRVRSDEVRGLVASVVPRHLREKMVFRIKGELAYMNKPARKPDFTVNKGNEIFNVWVFRRDIVVLWYWENGVPFLFRFEGVTAEEVKNWLENL